MNFDPESIGGVPDVRELAEALAALLRHGLSSPTEVMKWDCLTTRLWWVRKEAGDNLTELKLASAVPRALAAAIRLGLATSDDVSLRTLDDDDDARHEPTDPRTAALMLFGVTAVTSGLPLSERHAKAAEAFGRSYGVFMRKYKQRLIEATAQAVVDVEVEMRRSLLASALEAPGATTYVVARLASVDEEAALSQGDSPAQLREALECLSAARLEESGDRAIAGLSRARELLADLPLDESVRTAIALVERELARESGQPSDRANHWRRAVRALQHEGVPPILSPAATITHASIAVDMSQDGFSGLTQGQRRKVLSRAKELINRATTSDPVGSAFPRLLARQAAVLRAQAFFTDRQEGDLAKPLRAARRAFREDDNDAGIALELGLCEAAHASRQPTDALYAQELRSAEGHIREAAQAGLEEAHLALSQFLRLNYRPIETCQEFPRLGKIRQWRRLLRESWVLAEAVIQMKYGHYPEDLYRGDLVRCISLLERAVAGGYRHARLVIDLAFLYAIVGDSTAAQTVIVSELVAEEGVSWGRVMDMLSETDPTELPALGFALGINSSAAMSRLGTFVFDVVKDATRAEVIYRSALTLGPNDPVALTNLARLLAAKGDTAALTEARRHIQKASTLADRRFPWWSQVKLGPAPGPREVPLAAQPFDFDEWADVARRSALLCSLLGPQPAHEYEVEALLFEAAKLTPGLPTQPGYQVIPSSDGGRLAVGHLVLDGRDYSVRCIWPDNPIGASDIRPFESAVTRSQSDGGILVSMADFLPDALQYVTNRSNSRKQLMLVNRDEVSRIGSHTVGLDEILRVKSRSTPTRSFMGHANDDRPAL